MLYALLRPLLFRLDGETAHRLTVKAMTLLPSGKPDAEDAALASPVAGLRFPNPVGLAAGFDKDGEVAHTMHRLGFGFRSAEHTSELQSLMRISSAVFCLQKKTISYHKHDN